MALSKERHQELMDILERTSMRPKGAKAPEYPQSKARAGPCLTVS